jgi:hypothetical protein
MSFLECNFPNLPSDNIHLVCDYCGEYKKIAVLSHQFSIINTEI